VCLFYENRNALLVARIFKAENPLYIRRRALFKRFKTENPL